MATLDELTAEKEKELEELKQKKAQVVHETLRGIHQELCTERQKMAQLQEDFDYNLRLLSERDVELGRYESVFTELKRVVSSLLAENSQLRVTVDGLHGDVAHSKQALDEVKVHYIKRIEQLQLQMDAIRSASQREVESERDKLERLQRQLEQRLLEVEGEMATQKEQLTAQFEELLKRREHEFQLKHTQLNAAILSKEKQLRVVSRELEQAESAKMLSQQCAQEGDAEVERLRKTVREQEWRLEDERSTLHGKLADVQTQLDHSLSLAKTQQEEFERRRAELDHLVREKESVLRAAKEAHSGREGELERQVMELKREWERESRRVQWQRQDERKEKDGEIQRLKERLAEVQAVANSSTGELTQEIVARDVQIQSLQTTIERLREELSQQTTDVDQYREEMVAAREREKSVEISKAQLQLDWEQRLGECERQVYSKHQLIIQQLTSSRDKLGSEVKESRLMIEKLTTDLQGVRQERDVAIATLNKHGLASECHMTDHMTQLRQQNKELQTIIEQMRHDMEEVTNRDAAMATKGYTEHLESEMSRLKSENRQLEERLRSLGKPPSPGGVPRKQHQSHLIALSDTIATLQRENTTLELKVTQMKTHREQLKAELKAEREKVYTLKACQVPETKLHGKLLQATKVIISLVKEKEELAKQQQQQLEEKEESPLRPVCVEKSVQVELTDRSREEASPAAASTLTGKHQEETLDMSLSSLKFSECSLMGGHDSLQRVLHLAEDQLMDSDNDRGMRHSTPELELVGNKAPVQRRPLAQRTRPVEAKPHARHSNKTRRVRNYNSKH